MVNTFGYFEILWPLKPVYFTYVCHENNVSISSLCSIRSGVGGVLHPFTLKSSIPLKKLSALKKLFAFKSIIKPYESPMLAAGLVYWAYKIQARHQQISAFIVHNSLSMGMHQSRVNSHIIRICVDFTLSFSLSWLFFLLRVLIVTPSISSGPNLLHYS